MCANKAVRFLLIATCLVAAYSMFYSRPVEAVPGLACLKDAWVKMVSQAIMRDNEMVQQLKEAVDNAAVRYEAEVKRLKEAGMPVDETDNSLFTKLVAEEVDALRKRMEPVKKGEETLNSGLMEPVKKGDETLNSDLMECIGDESQLTQAWAGWNHEEVTEQNELDQLKLKEQNEQLFSVLQETENEMGYALDETTKANLKARTKTVLAELINNEARHIAMALLTAYMTGGSSGISLATLLPYFETLKVKLVSFLVNAVLDVINSLMGHQVEITPYHPHHNPTGPISPASPASPSGPVSPVSPSSPVREAPQQQEPMQRQQEMQQQSEAVPMEV